MWAVLLSGLYFRTLLPRSGLTGRDDGKFGSVLPRTTDSYRLPGDSIRGAFAFQGQGLGSGVWGRAWSKISGYSTPDEDSDFSDAPGKPEPTGPAGRHFGWDFRAGLRIEPRETRG